MTNDPLQTSTMYCYRVDWLHLEREIPRRMYVASLSDDLPLWKVAQLVQERINDDGLVVGVRDEGEGVVIMHNQTAIVASPTSLAIEAAYFYRVEWRELEQGSLITTYVVNASDDVPLWRIAELFQSRIEEHSFIVAIDDVRAGLALLPLRDPESLGKAP
jgi:hypothetical protein